MPAELRIGTSGYSFPDWVGIVYPDGTRPSQMLAIYARDFDAVEINFTYYRDPTPAVFAGMLRHVPSDFEFVIKAPRGMTHDRDDLPRVATPFVDALAPLVEAGQLGGVLLQFPQSFHADAPAEEFLRQVAEVFQPHGIPAHVEFRHDGWQNERVYDLLRRLGLGFVNVDLPRLRSLPRPTNVATTGTGYYRLHGRNAAEWHAPSSGGRRYDYLYSEGELDAWAARVQGALSTADKIYVFNNNCHKGSSFVNALRLKQQLGQSVRSQAEADGSLFSSADPADRLRELTQRVQTARAQERGAGP